VPAPTVNEDSWHQPWSIPVRKAVIATALIAASGWVGPVFPQPAAAASGTQTAPATQVDARIQYESRTQYQAVAFPVLTDDQRKQFFESRWHQPWSEPVRFRVLPVALQHTQQQGSVSVGEQVGEDKRHFPWSEPVRERPGLKAHLQQALIAPVLNPSTQITQNFESRWHYAWSEPQRQKIGLGAYLQQQPAWSTFTPSSAVASGTQTVPGSPLDVRIQYEARLQYQAQAYPIFFGAAETVTVDKWIYPWREPVRQKAGLSAQLQQAHAGPVLPQPTAVTVFTETASSEVQFPKWIIYQTDTRPLVFAETVTVDKWYAPWREPVRQKPGLAASLQQFLAAPPFEDTQEPGATYESPWHQPWTEPVRTRQLAAAQQQSLAFQLEPNTQIIQGFESRWHYAWSEPVRVRQLATAQQSTTVLGVPSFETVTVDKWVYPWTEPVRSKPGLGAALQQSTAQTVLNPDTQITQNFESRWHYAWSEPVRVKPQLATGLQQPAAWSSTEIVNVEKWFAPWREPVRQKPGLSAQLQSFFTEVLEPNTQIIQGFESRWHYPWSEPVRTRQFASAQQQSHAEPPTSVFETVTVDKWIYPYTDPVRSKPGLPAQLQQAFIGTTLEPNTQIIQTFESRWHYPWSEPVRQRPGLLPGLQQAVAWIPFVTEVVTTDKWFAPWREPVRQKPGLAAGNQQFFAADTAVIPTSKLETWFAPLSEPNVKYRRPTSWYQPFTADTQTIPRSKIESLWHYPWSEPVRRLSGLAPYLQQYTTPAVPPFQNLQRTIPWYAPLNEPVRIKMGLEARYQQTFTTGTKPITNLVNITLSATEVNTDSALFSIIVYNQASTAVVSVREIPRIRTAVASMKEIQAAGAAAVSTEEVTAIDSAAASVEET
jgi:hypothetical protein